MKCLFLVLAVVTLISSETKAWVKEMSLLEDCTFNQLNSPYGPVHSRSVLLIKGFIAANKNRQEFATSLISEIAGDARAGAEAARSRDAQKIKIYKENGEYLGKMLKNNGAVFCNPDPKKWVKEDWTHVALGKKSGLEAFNPILALYNAAIETDSGDNYTADAMLARRALLVEFAPFSKTALTKIEDIKSQLKAKKITQKQASDQVAEVNDGELDSFMSMIRDVAIETKPVRDKNKM